MAAITFKPIHQPDGRLRDPDSRASSALSSVTDIEQETPATNNYSNSNNERTASKLRNNHRHQRHTDCSSVPPKDPKFLLRRSSSAMRVRELRDVLSEMTSEGKQQNQGNDEVKVSGSQNARLLVASQQCLISRLQDLRHELDSMDNEVARVRGDIMSSRRYFSAITGMPIGPAWPKNRQMDSAYTSPTSFISRSCEVSPYSSDTDSFSTPMNNSTSPFQSLQEFDDLNDGSKAGQLTRSDSCSSFLSWRSDVELAGVFPEEPVPVHALPQKQFS